MGGQCSFGHHQAFYCSGRYWHIMQSMMKLVLLFTVLPYLLVLGNEELETPREKCPSPGSISSLDCAKVYNLQNCDGDHTYISEHDTITDLPSSWDDRISSMVVRTNCIFTGHKDKGGHGQ